MRANSFDISFLLLIAARRLEEAARTIAKKGGTGSGNFGHAGRPGEVGGSASSEGGEEKETIFHGTSADKLYSILFEGITPQRMHNFADFNYEGERKNLVWVATGETGKAMATAFVANAERVNSKPAVIIEAKVPKDFFKKNARQDSKYLVKGAYSLPEVRPEWISNVFDSVGNVATKTIDSLKLERFEKKEETVTVYIPIDLDTLKEIINRGLEDGFVGTKEAKAPKIVRTREGEEPWDREVAELGSTLVNEWKRLSEKILSDIRKELDVEDKSQINKKKVKELLTDLRLVGKKFKGKAKSKVRKISLALQKRAEETLIEEEVEKGGPGSGNFGHAGRPGEVGGSALSDEEEERSHTSEKTTFSKATKEEGQKIKDEISTWKNGLRKELANDMADSIKLGSSNVLIGRVEGKIVSMAETADMKRSKEMSKDYAYIYEVATKERGHGVDLMTQICKEASKNGIGIELSALPSAKPFYIALGMTGYKNDTFRFTKEEADAFIREVEKARTG